MTEEQIIAEVIKRLTLPRVGLLCSELDSPLPECDAFSWVAYPRKEPESLQNAKRVYALDKIARPEDEGASLSVLVVVDTPLTVVGELLDGVPRSREGALILGCLGRGVPVIMEGSLSSWAWYGGTACGKHLASRLDRLREWGLCFLTDTRVKSANLNLNNLNNKAEGKQAEAPAPASISHAETSVRNVRPANTSSNISENVNTGELTLRGPGWITWSELNGRLKNVKAIRLTGGVKLTMEARDQLIRYGIKLVEA